MQLPELQVRIEGGVSGDVLEGREELAVVSSGESAKVGQVGVSGGIVSILLGQEQSGFLIHRLFAVSVYDGDGEEIVEFTHSRIVFFVLRAGQARQYCVFQVRSRGFANLLQKMGRVTFIRRSPFGNGPDFGGARKINMPLVIERDRAQHALESCVLKSAIGTGVHLAS